MVAAVSQRGLDLRTDSVNPLFSIHAPLASGSFYAPAPDGRFLVNIEPDIESDPPPITVVVNWLASLRK
jgi:hypothetical protein